MVGPPQNGQSKQAPYLVLIRGQRVGAVYMLTDLPLEIGREQGVMPDPEDRNISRLHATIKAVGGDLVIVDNNSTNGTLVNSRKIQRHTLRHLDRIEIGTSLLKFICPDQQGADVSERFSDRSFLDKMTGLHNKDSFDERLPLAFASAAMTSAPFGLLMIQVDPRSWDEWGGDDPFDDRAVVEFAELLSSLLLEDQELYRIGHDLFAMVLQGTSAKYMADYGELIRQSVEVFAYSRQDKPVNLTVSVGYTYLGGKPPADADVFTYLDAAQEGLNEAHKSGGNRVCGNFSG